MTPRRCVCVCARPADCAPLPDVDAAVGVVHLAPVPLSLSRLRQLKMLFSGIARWGN